MRTILRPFQCLVFDGLVLPIERRLKTYWFSEQTKSIDEMDYLLSGAIPPNPSELLMRPRMKELLEILKSIDKSSTF